jgi:flagellar motor switch protein FliG
MAAEIGPIPPEERRALLAELQLSQSRLSQAGLSHDPSAVVPNDWNSPASNKSLQSSWVNSATAESANEVNATVAGSEDSLLAENAAAAPAWTSLSVDALLRFVRHERPAVIAVILHQLPPSKAAAVLQRLPRSTSRQVLQGIRDLQEIDPEAMAAIDEHLSQRLSEYRHRIENEIENARRINQLLDAAPPELKQQWSHWLNPAAHPEREAPEAGSEETPHSAYSFSVRDQFHRSESPPSSMTVEADAKYQELPQIYAFSAGVPTRSEPEKPSGISTERLEIERSELQADFAKILSLQPEQLAVLLGALDSQTIMLSLAGAQPNFMKQFNDLLEPKDARILEDRLKRIGPVQLRDIDEAQRKVVHAFRVFRESAITGRAA